MRDFFPDDWVAYQFIGNSIIAASGSRQLKSGQHIGCTTNIGEKLICQIDHGKTWMVFIDISGIIWSGN